MDSSAARDGGDIKDGEWAELNEESTEGSQDEEQPSVDDDSQPRRVFGLGRPRTDEDDNANKHGPDTDEEYIHRPHAAGLRQACRNKRVRNDK